MNTSMITIKIDPVTKRKAQAVAKKMGLSLSVVVKGYLAQVIRTKTAVFTDEIPNKYMIKALEESRKDVKEGFVSPSFKTAKEAIEWLKKPRKKYVNGLWR